MGFGDQEALDHMEADFPHGQEFGARLDSFRDRANAVALGELDDAATDSCLSLSLGAVADELAVDLDLDERKLVDRQELRPFGPEIVDGDADICGSGPGARSPSWLSSSRATSVPLISTIRPRKAGWRGSLRASSPRLAGSLR